MFERTFISGRGTSLQSLSDFALSIRRVRRRWSSSLGPETSVSSTTRKASGSMRGTLSRAFTDADRSRRAPVPSLSIQIEPLQQPVITRIATQRLEAWIGLEPDHLRFVLRHGLFKVTEGIVLQAGHRR